MAGITKKRLRIKPLFIVVGMFVCGCTNPPDGLRMQITPEKEFFGYGEDIKLTAEFTAIKGPLCISKPLATGLEMEIKWTEAKKKLPEKEFVYCGTGQQWVLLTYPILVAGGLLDVADLSDRFLVLDANQSYRDSVTLVWKDCGYYIRNHAASNEYQDKQRWPPGSYEVTAKFQNPSSKVIPFPLFWKTYDRPVYAKTCFVVESPEPTVDSWIQQMLERAADGRKRRPDDCYEVLTTSPYYAITGYYETRPECFTPCSGWLGEDDIMLFIEEGGSAIPKLMRHIRDYRPSGIHFHHPMWSRIDFSCSKEPVAKIVCYLIEAILRENPYFTQSYDLIYEVPDNMGEGEIKSYSLDQTVIAYESWFSECFDKETNTIICTADRLPIANWDYDLDYWDDVKESRKQQ